MPLPVVPIFCATLFTGRFTGHVQSLVERQDQRAGFGHAQALTHLHAGLFQAFDFFKQLAHESTTPLPM
jgi:hypothetical protein